MLSSLSIRNIVLIDQLTLEGEPGLSALTGETGAGKSILLDALGLVLGARADAGLVRHGEEQAVVTASFDLPATHPVHTLLREKEIPLSDPLILRRTLGRDGRSKAFINDAPASVQLLKETGALLVEIHGQFETQSLLDADTHRRVLDSYAGLAGKTEKLAGFWRDWRAAEHKLAAAIDSVSALREQEDYLRHAAAELEKLAPVEGEEQHLAEKRQALKSREKLAEAAQAATLLVDGEDGLQSLLGKLQTVLQRLRGQTQTDLAPLLDGLARAGNEIGEVSYQLGKLGGRRGEGRLEDIEERYFALKDCARKHRVTVDELPRIQEEIAAKLRLVTDQEGALFDLRAAVAAARENYAALAKTISAERRKIAGKLDKAVNAELPPLKLDKAVFSVSCVPLEKPEDWRSDGMDDIQFMVAPNPGAPAAALDKIASGGEMARFMLALKVILAETGSIPTLVFDEVDSGIGGATADAVGERLQRLGRKYQVLVVTHSPQVAARASHHWHVSKSVQKGATVTRIAPLAGVPERAEEIARMLSGAEITREARAQAARLLESHDVAA